MLSKRTAPKEKGYHCITDNERWVFAFFWVVTLEDGGSTILQNDGILPHHYKVLQSSRQQPESSSPCKSQISREIW